ncbi:hypothetical protein F0L17_14250 [Streptomyces sp. TRM43335]|uniref:Uncharacterized protein n=1 Tax=Streptomyces taklimakanensis TaxID=2569853 RepID=A0A6G2BDU4_9ACTN|nr:hypothetical protein [Streptomyces taklimakanensis]MTE20249.1 hypothetical protein [Streptomyces taklimakanensis]
MSSTTPSTPSSNPNTTPVTEIRAAVEKLRKHLKHATDGPWVADAWMNPRLGTVLADWLELEADVIAARLTEHDDEEIAVDRSGDHALAVARLINNPECDPWWTPRGGHGDLCAYASGIGPNCTCTTDSEGGAR